MGIPYIVARTRASLLARFKLRFAKSALLKLLAICVLGMLFFALVLHVAEKAAWLRRATGRAETDGEADRTYRAHFCTYPKTIRAIMILFMSGFEMTPPETTVGTMSAFGAIAMGSLSLSLFTAEISSYLVVRKLRGRTGMDRLKLSGHILICGWTKDVPFIIEELHSEDLDVRKDIVIIDEELDQYPLDDPNVHFVKGDPTEADTLLRAGILNANTALCWKSFWFLVSGFKFQVSSFRFLA